MMNIRDCPSNTKASDVMVRDVLTLRPADSLAEAAVVFLREQISGAPVVELSGACVDVLSASDLVGAEEKAAAEREKVASSSLWPQNIRAGAGRKTRIVRYWMRPRILDGVKE